MDPGTGDVFRLREQLLEQGLLPGDAIDTDELRVKVEALGAAATDDERAAVERERLVLVEEAAARKLLLGNREQRRRRARRRH